MRIDLQVHSTYSDGRDTVEELFEMAEENNLAVLSITDHDTVGGMEEIIKLGQKTNIQVIPGIEVTTEYYGKRLHMLGYGFDYTHSALVSYIDAYANYRKKHYSAQLEKLISFLPKDKVGLVDVFKYTDAKSSFHFMPGLVRYLYQCGVVEEESDGFRYLQYIDSDRPIITPQEAIVLIHQAEGKAVLSHPFAPKISLKSITQDLGKQEKIIRELAEQGMDGVECYQSGHSDEDVVHCNELAGKYSLLITAGSDWHGVIGRVGESIKEYLPYYPTTLGELAVPISISEEVIRSLTQA